MTSRQEYFQQYYQEHKQKMLSHVKKDYKKHKKDHLTYQHKYYKDNREAILAKSKIKSLAFKGHAFSIYKAIVRYAKKWNLPYSTFEEFYDNWTSDDPTYNELYDAWKESEYDEYLSPVVMRAVKKYGYMPDNLKWDIKKNYSWWNEDSTIFKEVSNKLEEQQKERNKRDKEWRKKVRQQWKEKQKAKHDVL